jgi:hypothetical protein
MNILKKILKLFGFTGVAKMNGGILLFRRNSIWSLGPKGFAGTDFTFKQINKSICVSKLIFSEPFEYTTPYFNTSGKIEKRKGVEFSKF